MPLLTTSRRRSPELAPNADRIPISCVRCATEYDITPYTRIDGGEFTPRERVKAQHRLNQQSRSIYRQKHDGQSRN